MWIYNMKLLKRTVLEISVRYYKPRRAILYVPGNDLKKINKIQSLTIDCVALDCEDGVALNKKFSDCIDKYIKQRDKINLIIFLESAKAFINISEICKTLVTLADKQKIIPNSLVFGSDDYCASIGATRTEDATEVLYARQKLVLYAKAYNFQAIDMVYIKFKDLEGLIRQSEQGRHMGFTGKQVIHPDQIEVVQKSFSPTLVQVEWAKGLLRAFEEHQIKGIGAFTYEGSMIDMPTIKQAQNIIELMNSIK
ncbi:citramalyl-CoA lyase, mitochondrial-like isoform X2 [Diorhabda sublineata]|uniref:citramalyl-CoA lyase, mitochondrial-like isoform X2 n=1 Tax=Diorhabda sublineata TaxID=1163346 RepID=UPI0024E0B8D2|nr:citramalyl-CoA lyase, mitochondrial-like isoform X2 [Diorhabda sublineata]